MSDEQLRGLAANMGIASNWTDQHGETHEVGVETIRKLLSALTIPVETDHDVRNALSAYEAGIYTQGRSNFLTARVEQNLSVPVDMPVGTSVEIELENGATRAVSSIQGYGGALTLPPFETPGYHLIRVGGQEFSVAVAPSRCMSINDLTRAESAFGLGAQVYSLRRKGDGGIGDFGAVATLARKAGALGADALAISPVHALYSAFPDHFSPYSPSSRLVYNPLHADPAIAFPESLITSIIEERQLGAEMQRLEALDLIDWPRATAVKMTLLRGLYEQISRSPQGLQDLAAEFSRFREHCPQLVRDHAVFETIHGAEFGRDRKNGHWRNWDESLRAPDAAGVAGFVEQNQDEVDFHIFLQWLIGKSYSECQRVCRDSGMKIGLIADLAIGMDSAGSHAWSRQSEILNGVSIGAPPDYYNADGQSWGLTSFSPRGLFTSGFQPFIDTLRAVLRHAGGVRIDHVMGLRRLWLVPDGAKATEGAYLEFPVETMFRLLALESWRHRAIVIGEDLGIVPDGFRDVLSGQALAGMRVLRFERDGDFYTQPRYYDPTAVAMTTTHDLVPTAGWWAGTDMGETIVNISQAEDEQERQDRRAWNRGLLWGSFEEAGIVSGDRPEPWDTMPVVDAAVKFIAATPCTLKLLSIEDALGVEEQPNVPGTTTEAPNWRHRLKGDVEHLLDNADPKRRLGILAGVADA